MSVVHVETELSLKCVGEDITATARELERVLDNTHTLRHDVITYQRQQQNTEEDSDEEPNRFCDVKGCKRNFIHSHIGAASSQESRCALTLEENEIYDKQHFMRY